MYLKRIEVNGFKSFANKIVFEFPQGITGIVGPNGSGKSNIGDAVRWVLGEQSARQLRGAKMEDVIFSGTQSRKPLGFAYVAIVFDNTQRKIALDFDEVKVARRVYRSGESEYLINGAACRRRDVVELFYDTGIGKEGYSIIGQGQVEKILSGKMEDSRELFDEAAGIAKYKKNRAVTEKSLQQERQNLERVTDILTELEKQVGPLKVQSKKAKEYLLLRDQERILDIHLFLYDYESMKTEQDSVKRQHGIVTKDLEETRKVYEGIKEKNTLLKKHSAKLTEQIEQAQTSREALQTKKEEADRQILIVKNKMDSNRVLGRHYLELIQQTEEEKKEKQELLLVSQNKVLAQKEALAFLEQKHKDGIKELEDLCREKEHISDSMAKEQENRLAVLSSHSDTKEKMSRYTVMEEQLEIRNAEYNSRLLAFGTELNAYNQKSASLERELETAKKQVEKEVGVSKELFKQWQQLEDVEENCHSQMDRCNQEYMRVRSRYETLVNITERYEGYNQSIRHIMEQKKENPEILGVVADIMTLDQKYETSIEIALGGALQNIVTQNEAVAKKMIAFLKKNRYGRATFLPLTSIRKRNLAMNPAIFEEDGVIGLASTLVRVEERFQDLVDSLLGRTIVVDTIEHALQLAKKNRFSLRIVTLEGELLNPGGAITGGAFRHSGNLLGRRREIEECKDAMKKRKEEYQQKKEVLLSSQKEKEELQKKREAQKEEADRLSFHFHDLQNQVPELYKNQEALREKIAALKEEHRSLKEQLAEIADQKRQLSKAQISNEKIHEANTGIIEELQKKFALQEEAIAKKNQEKNEILLEISKRKQQIDFYQNDCSRLEGEIASCAISIGTNQNQQKELEEQNTVFQEEEKHWKERREVLEKEKNDSEKGLSIRKEEQKKVTESQSAIFKELEEQNERLLLLEKEEGRLCARKERLETEIAAGISYMWENYELTYRLALEAKQYDLSSGEVSEQRTKKKELAAQMKSLGNVNLDAIEEYKNVGERYEFLKKQYDDICLAEKKLLQLIEELNAAMRERFHAQFGEIRTMFTTVFQDLFEGGTASLELMDENDILECGIRIVAQPPGKKLQNIMLLSGGERALTAIALLFAIQNLKPSPFCLLDEIEAALDDANIVRFSKYLRKLSEDTQFIVITHRRGTMSAADALYGITMQEKGVSTLISVDLIDRQLR